MAKLVETGNMNDTAPLDSNGERYVGPEVDSTTGKLICPKCGKPYDECKCDDPETTVHSKNIPDDLQKIKMGNVSDEKKEEAMDFYDGLDDLLLEEFQTKKAEKTEEPKPVEESMKNPTPEEVKVAKTFTESFKAYMERNGDRIDRKPSDVGTKPNSMTKNLYYADHFHTKIIH
jgi:hypothetical protein